VRLKTKVPPTFHSENQSVQWEPTENVKFLAGTTDGMPATGSGRLNALCDHLKLKETFQRNKENPFSESESQLACSSVVHLAPVPVL